MDNPLLLALHKQAIRRIANGESADEVLSRMAVSLLRDYPDLAKLVLDGPISGDVDKNSQY